MAMLQQDPTEPTLSSSSSSRMTPLSLPFRSAETVTQAATKAAAALLATAPLPTLLPPFLPAPPDTGVALRGRALIRCWGHPQPWEQAQQQQLVGLH